MNQNSWQDDRGNRDRSITNPAPQGDMKPGEYSGHAKPGAAGDPFLIGDAMADDLNLHSRVSSAAAVRLARTVLGAASLGQRLLPDPAKRRLEDFNHGLGRRTLKVGLGGDPARWGFKALA